MIITLQDKLNEINRELKMRETVYPSRIARGMMTKEHARRQRRVLNAIKQDYIDKIKEQNGDQKTIEF
jgi:hypothetical protein